VPQPEGGRQVHPLVAIAHDAHVGPDGFSHGAHSRDVGARVEPDAHFHGPEAAVDVFDGEVDELIDGE
jgi:hypothetical protein